MYNGSSEGQKSLEKDTRIAELQLRVIEALIDKLKDSHEEVRRNAAEALGNLGLPSTPELQLQLVQALMAKLEDSDELVCLYAAQALRKLVEALEGLDLPSTPELQLYLMQSFIAKLEDSDKLVCLYAVEALGRLAEALGKLGLPSSAPELQLQVVEALIAKLGNGSEYARAAAALALGNLRLPAIHDLYLKAIGALIATLKDSKWYVRDAAAKALEKLSVPAVEAASALPLAAMDVDPGVEKAKVETAAELVALGQLEELASRLQENYQPKNQEPSAWLEEVARQIQGEQQRPEQLHVQIQEVLARIGGLRAGHLQLEQKLQEQYEQLKQGFLELQKKVCSVERETSDKKAGALSPERRAYYHSFVSMLNGFCAYSAVNAIGYASQRIDSDCARFVDMIGALRDVFTNARKACKV